MIVTPYNFHCNSYVIYVQWISFKISDGYHGFDQGLDRIIEKSDSPKCFFQSKKLFSSWQTFFRKSLLSINLNFFPSRGTKLRISKQSVHCVRTVRVHLYGFSREVKTIPHLRIISSLNLNYHYRSTL